MASPQSAHNEPKLCSCQACICITSTESKLCSRGGCIYITIMIIYALVFLAFGANNLILAKSSLIFTIKNFPIITQLAPSSTFALILVKNPTRLYNFSLTDGRFALGTKGLISAKGLLPHVQLSSGDEQVMTVPGFAYNATGSSLLPITDFNGPEVDMPRLPLGVYHDGWFAVGMKIKAMVGIGLIKWQQRLVVGCLLKVDKLAEDANVVSSSCETSLH